MAGRPRSAPSCEPNFAFRRKRLHLLQIRTPRLKGSPATSNRMKDNHTDRPVKVGLISLGCAKNLNDAEIMLGTLLKDGMEITNDAAEADVVIVNTCSFIDSAQEESVDAI